MQLNMDLRMTVFSLWLFYFASINADIFSVEKLRNYAKYWDWDGMKLNSSENELWNGLINDCSKKATFSCIQKNAYAYLDNTFVDRDNITVFDGFVLSRNDLNYETFSKQSKLANDVAENLVETTASKEQLKLNDNVKAESKTKPEDSEETEYKTPLEEITDGLRDKAIKFILTRDYELQLPHFFEDSTLKISPREFDEKGALIRVEIGQRGIRQGRLFKKIRKFIQNKLLVSFFALILIIKLIKIKFLFVIPFLFGVGAAKKLFLKLLLFLVPAFAHVFKLCSSYYSSHGHHHHHHQIAHHHHHVPVPVPVPTYYGPSHHHSHNLEEHEGYEYSHPHIQLRKDIEELKEWGIKPMDEPYIDHEDSFGVHRGQIPLSPVYQTNTFAVPHQGPLSRPTAASSYQPKYQGTPIHAQNLAYNGYLEDNQKLNRRISAQSPVSATTIAHVSQVPASPINVQLPAINSVNLVASNVPTPPVNSNPNKPYTVYPQEMKINGHQQAIAQTVIKSQQTAQQTLNQKIIPQTQTLGNNALRPGPVLAHQTNYPVTYDDLFYGPILERLDDIFAQLRFTEENCRERLLCSMYKNPTQYSPHSNLVSNELSRDPEELKRGDTGSNSSRRFYRYVSAARLGQDNGDCLRTYPCQINTE